jgi:hypothetical protein
MVYVRNMALINLNFPFVSWWSRRWSDKYFNDHANLSWFVEIKCFSSFVMYTWGYKITQPRLHCHSKISKTSNYLNVLYIFFNVKSCTTRVGSRRWTGIKWPQGTKAGLRDARVILRRWSDPNAKSWPWVTWWSWSHMSHVYQFRGKYFGFTEKLVISWKLDSE